MEDGSKVAARTPVEAGNHNLVEVAVRILAEDAVHSLAEDTVVHSLAAVVADHIPAVAAAVAGTVADHSPQERHTVRVAVLRSHLPADAILSRPGCHMTSQLRPRAS